MDDLPNEEAANLSQSCRFSVLQLIWVIGRVNIRNLGFFGGFLQKPFRISISNTGLRFFFQTICDDDCVNSE